MRPLVCIVIVNWNGGNRITNCLESLKKTRYDNYRIIVLDNNSSDDSIERINACGNAILLQSNENLGFTKGSNKLYRYVLDKYDPDYVCNMNNDIITIQPEWLYLMVDELEKEESRGICGNKLLFEDGRVQLLYLERHPTEYIEKDIGQYDFVRETEAVGGACILIKRKVLNNIGGTCEQFFYGPDDIGFCYRARKAGFKIIYTGLSKTVHVGSSSYNTSSKDFIYRHQSYGMMLFAFRHGPTRDRIMNPINQLIRAFATRKDPFKKKSLSNTYFHISFPRRLYYFIVSFFSALKNRNKIKQEYFNGKE